MKKNFLGTILGSLALMLGFISCKKDCTDCIRYTYSEPGGGSYSYSLCQDNFEGTQEEWDYYIAYYTAYAATNPNFDFETFEECE